MFQSCLCRSKFVPMTCISSKHRGSSWRLHHVLFLMACFCLLPDCPICGEEDFWRFDGKVLTRIHERPPRNLFDPSVAMDMPVDAEKLQAVRVTKIVRQGAETSVSQEDEDWRAIEARGSFPYLFTGESFLWFWRGTLIGTCITRGSKRRGLKGIHAFSPRSARAGRCSAWLKGIHEFSLMGRRR